MALGSKNDKEARGAVANEWPILCLATNSGVQREVKHLKERDGLS